MSVTAHNYVGMGLRCSLEKWPRPKGWRPLCDTSPVSGRASRSEPTRRPPKMTPKRGRTPRGGSACAKFAKNGRFWAKKGQKWPFSGKSGQKVFKNALFCTSIAPRIRGGCPRGKNPPIYTVLNAAFSAPPPPGAPWWDTTPRRPPTASRSRPRVQASQACPQNDGIGFLL